MQSPKACEIEQTPQSAGLQSAMSDCIQRPFRLFDLPPELRDHIYDKALVNFRKFKLSGKVEEMIGIPQEGRPSDTNAEAMLDEIVEAERLRLSLQAHLDLSPNANMLLSSKSIKAEYEARAKQFVTFVLKDHDQYSFQLFTVPQQAKEVHWAELHIILFCHLGSTHANGSAEICQAAFEVVEHRQWIENVLSQLEKLKGLSIHAYLCHDKYHDGMKEKVPCEGVIERKVLELTDLPKLKELSMYKYDFSVKPNLDGKKLPMLRWTSERGPRFFPPPPVVSDEDDETAEPPTKPVAQGGTD